MRRGLLALLALVVLLPLLLVPSASAQEPAPSVLVIGVPGLSWDDLSQERTPTLLRLGQGTARGVLSVKAAGALTCPADGWLTLGAGNRLAASRTPPARCRALPDDVDVALTEARAVAADSAEGAEVGSLAAALDDAGECVEAIGDGAALAVGGATRQPPGAAGCRVRLVDAGAAAASSLEAVDELVEREATTRPPGSALLVVGLSEAPGADRPSLLLALGEGPGLAPGALVSASTRRAPYVQLVDVAPTVLDLLDLPRPPEMTGQPWRSEGDPPSVDDLSDLALRAEVAKDVTVPFYVALLGALLVALLAAARLRSWRIAEQAGLLVTAAVGACYLAGLLPWWRAGLPLLVLLLVTTVLAAVVLALAVRVPGRLGPAGAVCAFVAAVLLVDLVTGARLQVDTVAGYSPLVAGRFAGIGNVAFGVLAAAVLLAAAALSAHAVRTGRAARPARSPAAPVAVLGLLAVAVDGAPPWGSDVGGVLALVPAFALLVMLRVGMPVTLVRLLLAGLAGALLVTVLAVADHARPQDDRTHLGRFVADVLDGTAGTVLRRKAEAVLGLLFASPVTALLPLVVAAAVYLVVRPPAPLARAFAAEPAWRHGLLAVGLAAAIGFAVNDSGAAVPALALLVAGPATIAVVARVSGPARSPDS